ncbi:MAG: 30S ribosomal protein S3 [Candidatus Marinimicrobia bacterium]|nr:30S ribosomal protein S3 [Candidatus Neomarinimicrobiota bacterium]MBT3683101.1 30S ribosomal protein S3 [Candidatus Neomarinimicrobiota bacterium]MBT3759807.1 30S ribosomal protein S3 [Candidatus Neomarinimicrobiota bacterium]MBT3895740.1 30S ribosomal protein S3 [Candidatus Neomarinimicrobiota bacterium]MBT4173221.1 30S ribosomal protein S3 [Candidatus Neomarinimicrobiota bacterium]
MGQKTNPIGLRLGINKTWDSIWFDEKNFAEKLHEDILLRKYIISRTKNASVSKVQITRTPKKIVVTIHTARPGIVIGRGGAEVEALKKDLKKMVSGNIQVNITEVKRPGLSAELVGQNIAQQLVKKVSYRRAVKKAIQSTMTMGALGIRIHVGGRLGGAEIARSETFRDGRVPLHTLRADIDYALVEANTTYGLIGIKVWIYHGEIQTKKSGRQN